MTEEDSYRKRWYQQRGLPYEPPKPGNLKTPKLKQPQREPGEDSPEDIGEIAA
jgi:hypothetical protein